MSDKPSPNPPVLEGLIAKVLLLIQKHPVITEEVLIKIALREHEDAVEINKALGQAKNLGYVIETGGEMQLTSIGTQWISEQASGLSMEGEDTESNEAPTKPYDVAKLKMEPKHPTIFQALRKIEKGEIDLKPPFQRAFVWDEVRQSRLIESVLIRIPLPAFYLDATNQTRWVVVDGLQRLTTLNRYCRQNAFALQGLQFLTELEGRRFSELPAHYRVLIEDDTELQFYNLTPGTPVEAKYTIFSRVNTGGLQLTPQEIRHALSQGNSTKLLDNLAQQAIFRSVTEGVIESLRMADRELILRSIAFMHLGTDKYREFNELDGFLLYAMKELNVAPEAVLRQLENDFLASLTKVTNIFGKYAFRKFFERGGRRSPFNKALFETWTVSTVCYSAEKLGANRELIINEFLKLINSDLTFVRSISASTGSYSAVSTRFSTIKSLLERVFND